MQASWLCQVGVTTQRKQENLHMHFAVSMGTKGTTLLTLGFYPSLHITYVVHYSGPYRGIKTMLVQCSGFYCWSVRLKPSGMLYDYYNHACTPLSTARCLWPSSRYNAIIVQVESKIKLSGMAYDYYNHACTLSFHFSMPVIFQWFVIMQGTLERQIGLHAYVPSGMSHDYHNHACMHPLFPLLGACDLPVVCYHAGKTQVCGMSCDCYNRVYTLSFHCVPLQWFAIMHVSAALKGEIQPTQIRQFVKWHSKYPIKRVCRLFYLSSKRKLILVHPESSPIPS